MLHTFSKVPIEHLRVYVEDCLNISDNIISVGCGNGVYEYEISKNIDRNKFILVDPNPESFTGPNTNKEYMKVNYSTVKDLITHNSKVVGDCVMLLIWPYSDSYIKMKIGWEANNYDFEAFKLLSPKSVICLYECPDGQIEGASGSIEMDKVLNHPDLFNYKEICTTKYGIKGKHGNIYPKIKWIAKKGSQVPKNKKCSELQEIARNISEVDIDKEVTCTIS